MLTDPQSVTISGTAISLPKVDARSETNVYASLSDGVTLFGTQRVTGKDNRRRATVSLQKEKIAADPLTAVNQRVAASVTVSFSFPSGFTSAEMEAQAAGLIAWLTASTNANLKKVLAGER